MDQKKKKKLFEILYIVLILVVIGTCLFLVNWISSEGAMCMKDPIDYAINQTHENITCSCYDTGSLFN